MVLFSALYVAAEFATVSARRTRIDQMAIAGSRPAKQLLPTLENHQILDKTIAACQVGITVSSLALGAYGQRVAAVHIAPILVSLGKVADPAAHSLAVTGILLLLTSLQMVVGELLPKSLALQYPEELAMATILPMRWSLALFRPFIWILNGSGNLLLRVLGHEYQGHRGDIHSPEEIEMLFSDSHEGGLLDSEAQHMLRKTLRLRDLVARQVMTPRTRMVVAPEGTTVTDLMRIISDAGYSRIPVFCDTVDNIVGVIHVKDLLRLHIQNCETVDGAIREVLYVPQNLPILEVWRMLEVNHQYMALILDERGCTAGLITYEDLIEEIFGELQDEFDQE